MEDKKGGEKKAVTDIDLSDVSAETFKQVLTYIYTDQVSAGAWADEPWLFSMQVEIKNPTSAIGTTL